MHLLAALAVGWILVEGHPGPEAWTLAGGGTALALAMVLRVWWVAGAVWALAHAARPRGGGGWAPLVALAIGACLPLLVLRTPFAGLGPALSGALLWSLGWLVRRRAEDDRSVDEGTPSGAQQQDLLWILAGVAAMLIAVALGRFLLRLGAGHAADVAVALPTFAGLAGLGALAFGRLVPPRAFALGRSIALVALALGGLAALRSAGSLATNRGLRTLVRRFGLDLSFAGTWRYDLLVGVSLWILPAFFVGMLWFCTANRRQRLALGAGAALGAALEPMLLRLGAGAAFDAGASQGLLWLGVLLSTVAASVGFWQGRRRGIALLASAGLVGAVWAFPFQPLEIAKPWSRVLQDVLWCREYPNGQFAVYGAGETDFMGRLDQRALTPPPESERLDQRMLIHSVQLLEPTRRLGSKVLLAGLLTPQRWQTLYAQGVRRVDRIGLVGGPGREAEAALFGGRMPDSVVGSWLAWEQAIEALEAGSYDLVIVPPGGPNLAANGQNGLLVAWQLVDEGLGERPDDGDDWLLCADGLQRFAAARVHGIAGDWLAPPGALRVNLGAPISLAPRRVWSSRREWERIDLARIGFWERMTRACTDPAQRTLFASLRDLQADQRHSSPFENEAQQLELTPERAEEWTQALLALPPSPFLDELAGGLARTLVGKREIEGIFRWIGQLSPALGHPYELERSLARAELESLDPNAAADRLEALDARFPGDDNLLGDWALALDQAGRWGSSVAVRERLVAKHPGEDALERAWIQALIRSGDPRGEAARASWLLRHADDEELRQLSQTGPQLVPVPSYTPMEGRHGPHDEGETPH